MKALLITIATVIASTGATPVLAQMDFSKIQKANGLAETISNAEHCGYRIDQSKLETYYVNSELDDPETLSFISSNIAMAEFGKKPDASTCTLSKMTARKIGILGE